MRIRVTLVSVFFTICCFFQVYGQGKYETVFKGKVLNEWTSEGLFGVNVYIESLGKGVVTDEDGRFEMIIPKGTFNVRFSRIDLKEEFRVLDIVDVTTVSVQMREKIYNLDEITIYSEKQDANIKSLDVGKNTISIEKINAIPAFMGESDVVKSLTLLPGVSTVGEGASGFNVRGGSVDQNLILQDGAIIFNPSHVFGFFSVFNPAMVKNATLYKGGISSAYGGRLSSVLDVELKEGDFQDYSINGGLGIITSKLAFDGPIIKNKLSILIGGRASYSDWLLHRAKDQNLKNSTAGFQDFNAKLVYRINDKNKLTYSTYLSNDKFAFASDTTFDWQTFNNVLNWKYLVNDKITSDVSLISGVYNYTIEDLSGYNSFEVKSKIHYQTLKGGLVYAGERNRITGGLEIIRYDFSPGVRNPLSEESGVAYLKLEEELSVESGLYVEDEYTITENVSFRAGLRLSSFHNFGPGTDFIYAPNAPRNEEFIIDTVTYGSGELIADYYALEPRFNLNVKLNTTSSIKASYNRNVQYLHLISNTSATTPTDIWKSSNLYLEPERGNQFSLGYFRNFRNDAIETSIEGYYKTASDIIDFKDGAVLLMNDNIEASLLPGLSQAYGLEFYANKKRGNLNGWASYTYSRIFRKVNGNFPEEIINKGKKYPANYDKPHDFTLSLNYKSNPVVSYGANFTYSTGRPATQPTALYNYNTLSNVFNFSQRNAQRIPDYHRLDLSMTIVSKPKVDRKWSTSWTIAVYNLYGRKNAYSVFYDNKYGSPPRAYQLSVLGAAFPSLIMNFNF